jgi:hypothetical protein
MKAARIRVTLEALRKLLDLPGDSAIVSVQQDADNWAHDSVTFHVRGVGRELPEGSVIPSMTLDELRAIKPEAVDPLDFRKEPVPEDFNKLR